MVAQIGHFIDNKRAAGKSGRSGDVTNPATGEVTAKVAFASEAEIDEAVQVAKKAQLAWAATPPLRRQRVMFNLKGLIEKRTDDLARFMSLEHGKTFDDAKGEVGRGLEVVEFSCAIAHHMRGDFTEQVATDMDTWSIRQPVGVVAGITPFNFPIMIPCWMGAMAVACGNAFILKPSEKDPSAPMLLAELFAEAGAPAGIFQVLNGDKVAVDALLKHPDVPAISFVGSTAIGATNACRRCAAPRTTW
jgi:malonate-semialdehyde dehydrogenase (acetylating)/methylmalonate-semialdehyde dehydrogenase